MRIFEPEPEFRERPTRIPGKFSPLLLISNCPSLVAFACDSRRIISRLPFPIEPGRIELARFSMLARFFLRFDSLDNKKNSDLLFNYLIR